MHLFLKSVSKTECVLFFYNNNNEGSCQPFFKIRLCLSFTFFLALLRDFKPQLLKLFFVHRRRRLCHKV